MSQYRLERLSLFTAHTLMARDILLHPQTCKYIIICFHFLCHPNEFRPILEQNQKQKLANDRSGTLSFVFRQFFFSIISSASNGNATSYHPFPCRPHKYPKTFKQLRQFLIFFAFGSVACLRSFSECRQMLFAYITLPLFHTLFGQTLYNLALFSYLAVCIWRHTETISGIS